jgi:uncharacterized membrane protein
MIELNYRRRLDADLERWQSDGVIDAATGAAIRRALGPAPAGIGVATIVGIVGGLLIAAAFLVFVAANWSEIPRVVRFVMLLAGIAGACGLGALFAQRGRAYLADTAVAVGAIIFGASIALVGQMYHLSGDFAGALLLWTLGALVAALLTNSRGALAVALVAGCAWSWMRAFEFSDVPHLPFIALWASAAGLALLWKSPVARHLVALAAMFWWAEAGIAMGWLRVVRDPTLVVAAGTALMLGAGLFTELRGPEAARALGATIVTYGFFALAIVLGLDLIELHGSVEASLASWVLGAGVVGIALAVAAAALSRRFGLGLLAVAIALGVFASLGRQDLSHGPWFVYALALAGALSLVLAGAMDERRPRLVAGWIGLAFVIGVITWTVEGTMLMRSLFLAVAGGAAIVLALMLGRLLPREAVR